ncbi:hypothetical protein Goklo_007046 [Gossypium klotzschianum]|uniref:DUF4283 domain-containing protein n=1 Tax=Gossypium klotzschianum TaxID=34286 RepID=A0A7J8VJM3_9ROSI|nr:hypothetical protein [Gossypium klotzschianum]
MEIEDAGGKKLPFKDTLSANTKQVGEVESWNEDLEIEVRDEDGAINYCPLTWKSIGFRALACRIQSLQKIEGNLQIVDLDNEYYLVKSISFLMKDLHLSDIVVWVRLPGLPYRYYNKDLFRAIAGVIGQAVKIDYNTIVGRRGKFVTLAVVVQSHQRKVVIGNGEAKANREIRKDKATTRILRFKILEGYGDEVDIEEVEHSNKDYSKNIRGILEQVPSNAKFKGAMIRGKDKGKQKANQWFR